MDEIYGRPPIPPLSKQSGEIVSRFRGWVETYGSSTKGYDRVTICVEPTEKYKMLRLTDEKGVMLEFTVRAPKKLAMDLDTDILDDQALLDEELRLAIMEGEE